MARLVVNEKIVKHKMVNEPSNTIYPTGKFHEVFIFFLVVFSLNYFSATFAQSGLFKSIGYTYMFCAVLMSIPYFFKKNYGLIFPVKLIGLAIIFSILMSYISWGQGLGYSASTLPYLLWFVFFYLLHVEFPIYKIERIVLFYGCLYIVLYFFQLFHSDIVYFGFKEEFLEDRGITRINFPGVGVFFLAYFISLSKVVEKSKFRLLYGIFLILGVLVTVLQVTRQNIALLLIISLFHFLKQASLVKKIALLLSISAIVLAFLYSDNPISRGLAETQKETLSDGKQYIRVVAGNYFLNDFSPNLISRIFGNGFPNNTSSYGKFTTYLEDAFGYYLADVGLIGFYVMFGIFPIIGYFIIFFKGLTMKVPERFYYVKYYLWLLLLTSLISDYVYSFSCMITNIFVVYCCQRIYMNRTVTRETIY